MKLRCFKRNRPDNKTPGVWVMDQPRTGAFFHGDEDSLRRPRYSTQTLENMATGRDTFFEPGTIQEISVQQAKEILKHKPFALDCLSRMIDAKCHEILAESEKSIQACC